jgi:hypothetical protein
VPAVKARAPNVIAAAGRDERILQRFGIGRMTELLMDADLDA